FALHLPTGVFPPFKIVIHHTRQTGTVLELIDVFSIGYKSFSIKISNKIFDSIWTSANQHYPFTLAVMNQYRKFEKIRTFPKVIFSPQTAKTATKVPLFQIVRFIDVYLLRIRKRNDHFPFLIRLVPKYLRIPEENLVDVQDWVILIILVTPSIVVAHGNSLRFGDGIARKMLGIKSDHTIFTEPARIFPINDHGSTKIGEFTITALHRIR